MGVRTTSQCCCGCSLRTGAIVIGTLGIVNGLAGFLHAAYVLTHDPHHPEATIETVSYIFAAIISMLQLTTGFMLILGADKERQGLVRSWLYFHYFEMGLSVAASVVAIGFFIHSGAPAASVITFVVSWLIILGLLTYCIMVVYAYYKQLVASEAEPQALPLPEKIPI